MSLFRNESPNLGPNTTISTPAGVSSIIYSDRIVILNPISASAVTGYWVYENAATTSPLATSTELVTKVTLDYTVAGPASLTMKVRKVTATATAPDAVAGTNVIELLTTPFTLDSTANTLQTGTLVTTLGTTLIKPGNKIGVLISSATQTGLVGLILTLYLTKQTS